MKNSKKVLLLVCILASLTTFMYSKGKSTVIKSADGKQSVDMTGTWICEEGLYTRKMIFGNNNSFKYGCGGERSGGPAQLFINSDGGIGEEKEFNQWWYSGTFKINGNIFITTCEDLRDFSRELNMKKGDTDNYIVNIVNENEVLIQWSGSSKLRTFKRK